MRIWKSLLAASVMVAVSAVASSALTQQADKPQYGAWGFDLTAMDPSTKPGDDFNRYANGAWLDRTTIPPDKPIASLRYLMSDRTEDRLHDLLEKAAASHPSEPTTLSAKLGAFYAAFMDEKTVEARGADPIAPELDEIRAAQSRDDIAALMGRTNSDFYGSLFNFGSDVDLKEVTRYAIYLGQGGLGLPDRDYYLKPSFAPQKIAYQAYVAKLLTLIDWPKPEANAASIVQFETRVADASWTRAEQRNIDKVYNPETPAELSVLAPGFDWTAFLASADLGGAHGVIVAEKPPFPRSSRSTPRHRSTS
jgi:putative endopeptidase